MNQGGAGCSGCVAAAGSAQPAAAAGGAGAARCLLANPGPAAVPGGPGGGTLCALHISLNVIEMWEWSAALQANHRPDAVLILIL